jgi:O-antigen ligase
VSTSALPTKISNRPHTVRPHVANSIAGGRPRLARAARANRSAATNTFAVALIYAGWAILLFDIHYFLGVKIAPPLGKLGMLILFPLVVLIALQVPVIIASMKSWVWYPPFALFIVAALASIPIAVNVGYARTHIQAFVTYYVVAVATTIYIRTPQQAMPILGMLCWRFLWWAIWARTAGYVAWHPGLANYDGFGALMVLGVATCFWFAIATPSKRLRLALLALSAYCVFGVVASFARGAFLSLLVVVFVIWLRSPRKGVAAFGLLGFAVVGIGAASFLFEDNFFWKEMASAFDEGAETGTGAQRWTLWKAAMTVWLQYPVFGVGAGNFGAFASQFFLPGQIEGFENPGVFYGFNTHNAYFQVLAELGLVGLIAYFWIIVDFFLKNRALTRPEAIATWNASGMGRKMNLRYVAYGLEGAMVATCLSNMLYASMLEAWLITLCAANRLLWALCSPQARSAPQPVRRGSVGRPGPIPSPPR